MPKNKKIKITIDNKKIIADDGKTIFQIAKENNIFIPSLCYHPDLEIHANCRMCLVEIVGKKGLHTSCSVKAEDGMKVITQSKDIAKARLINSKLLCAQKTGRYDAYQNGKCTIDASKVSKQKGFMNKKVKRTFGPSVEFDPALCIKCRNCVDVCEKQTIHFLELKGRGHNLEVGVKNGKKVDCVYCGQCVAHCPVGALKTKDSVSAVEKVLLDKNKTVVFQFAPSVRTSIGEEFGMPYGAVVTDKLVVGMKQLGADKVFDVSVGADFTTIEEADELIERITENKSMPMFTSCCPGWVKYIEFYRPEYIPHLTTVRSPQIILGGIIKTYWAKKEHINPKKVCVISIMPCVSKKYEIERKQTRIGRMKAVDYVITTRELASLFRKNNINLKTIKPQKADNPLGEPTGAGIIYGASGGVMESALRTAYAKLTHKALAKIDFKNVRGLEGFRKATVTIAGKKLKIAVVNGLANAKKVLEELDKDPKIYDYVEIMACFGGCIGGGGQPVPTNSEIRRKRAASLYSIDSKGTIRRAHENPAVQKIYKEFLTDKKIRHTLCYTSFRKKKREN